MYRPRYLFNVFSFQFDMTSSLAVDMLMAVQDTLSTSRGCIILLANDGAVNVYLFILQKISNDSGYK